MARRVGVGLVSFLSYLCSAVVLLRILFPKKREDRRRVTLWHEWAVSTGVILNRPDSACALFHRGYRRKINYTCPYPSPLPPFNSIRKKMVLYKPVN